MKILALFVLVISSAALADLDPDLAATQSTNETAWGVDLGMQIGQSAPNNGASPGVGTLFFLEPKLHFARGSWNSLVGSLRLSMGDLTFTDGSVESKVSTTGTMIKLGYGYSLGEDTQGVMSFGLGVYTGDFTASSSSVNVKSNSSFSGTMTKLAYDIKVGSFGSVGFHLDQYQVSPKETEDGVEISSFIVNVPSIALTLGF